MNRQQIAKIYDGFPESQRDCTREQFIREVSGALDPKQMARDVNDIVARRHRGRAEQARIDAVLQRKR